MHKISIQKAADVLQAEVTGDVYGDFQGISTDTRNIKPGELFFALRGENADGSLYAPIAAEKGAAAVVVDHPLSDIPIPQIIVSDTLDALARLAGWYRLQFSVPFIGVTGSVGKTTTREMIVSALGPQYCAHSNRRNFNNEIGVPRTLLEMEDFHKAAVIEMAMRGRGQIASLARIVRPNIGIVTNIGLTHIELLGSRDNISAAKGEMLEALSDDGFAVLNASDDYCDILRSYCRCRVVTFGIDKKTDFYATDIDYDEMGYPSFRINGHAIELKAPGVHQVICATGAIAVAATMGIALEDAIANLQEYTSPDMRMEPATLEDGIILINDAYNAAPDSMRAALETLSIVAGRSRRSVAILGDMKELGEYETTAHQYVGRIAGEYGVQLLVCVGEAAREIGSAFSERKGGSSALYFDDAEQAAARMNELLMPGDAVLVKGSRAMHLEDVAQAIITKHGLR
jgi:UDP-N-acetylmuramoyl-tripeptide--D-alanyl-D-alanine ligase